jgi:hypothetical protein
LKNTDEAKQNGIKEEANTSANTAAARISGGSDVMTDVAMSRELMSKLQKELK